MGGTNGVAGNDTSPLQFGNIADSAIESGSPAPSAPPSASQIYSSDGDGGTANRVVKVSLSSEMDTKVEWATEAIYNNPHSIALHARSGQLIVANREQNETRLI